ncbi:MAG: NAD(P)-binding protein [Gemmatimonadaceae bacterium]|nr:NAD(P)-binding protein [Gemmatimonadaceae bacterium]
MTDDAPGSAPAVTRRDFLGATLLGTGAALLTAASPLDVEAQRAQNPADPAFDGPGGVGDYAPSHGNMSAMLRDAHALRDGAYANAERRAVDTNERYDLVIVGGGAAGLGAAYEARRLGLRRVLILENHAVPGGECKRNELLVDGVRLVGPQGSNQFGIPAASLSRLGTEYPALWRDLGLPERMDEFPWEPWAPGIEPIEIPRDNYYYQLWNDESEAHAHAFTDARGQTRLIRNLFGRQLDDAPWTDRARADWRRLRRDPPRPSTLEGDALRAWLDNMTYDEYLTRELQVSPDVARYIAPRMAGGIGLGGDVLSAYAAYQIGLPGMDGLRGGARSWALADAPGKVASFPGGNDGIARHLLKTLIPSAVGGARSFADVMTGALRPAAFDRAGAPVRLRLGAMVVAVSQRASGAHPVTVTYARDGALARVASSHVVMAGGAWSALHAVRDLPESYRSAMRDCVRAPFLVVNVALRQWRFLYDQGITALSYDAVVGRDTLGYTANVRHPMSIGRMRQPLHPDRPIMLTMYVPFLSPGRTLREQVTAGRAELLGAPFRDLERRVRATLSALLARTGFDAERHIAGLVTNRWGHAYVCPAPGFYTGRDGTPAPANVLRTALGRIAFGNAELNGHQNYPGAIAEGRRAVRELVTG